MRTRIKICCISSGDEARTAMRFGADALGLVAKMPNGPGQLPDWLIAEIARSVYPPVATFLLTSEQTTEEIIHHVKRTDTNTVQITDRLSSGTYADIRTSLPYLKIVQVIHITGEESIDQAVEIQNEVDAILLDSGNPAGPAKTLGGTGLVHDWDISRDIVRQLNIPVFLAGGLHANNVKMAINTVKPYGVDVCSGVRTNGKLDHEKLKYFIDAVRQ